MTTIECAYAEKTQRMYARLAGFLFLWLIITGLAGMLTISHIVRSGTFAETAKRVTTGIWLTFAVKTQAPGDQQSARPAVIRS